MTTRSIGRDGREKGHPGRETPRIAVIIPTRDRAELLPRSIESLLGQEFEDWEAVVVDDGSEEDIRSVVERYEEERIRYVRQAPSGAATARNTGVAVSRAPYVTFLDSDDEAFPSWLGLLVEDFTRRDSDVVCCGAQFVFPPDHHRDPKAILPRDLGRLFGNRRGLFTQSGTYALRRAVFDAIGGFTDSLPASEHTELSFRLLPAAEAHEWRIDVIDRPLIRYYLGRADGLRKNDRAVYEAATYVARTHRQLLKKDPRRLWNYLSVAGVRAARLGEYQAAARHFLEAVRVRPRSARGWARLALALVPGLRRRWWRRVHQEAG